MTTITDIQAITPEQIESVYSGEVGKCCCGCSGKYGYTSRHAATAAARSAKVNDRQVSRILAVVKANAAAAKIHGACVSVDLGSRMYSVYLAG